MIVISGCGGGSEPTVPLLGTIAASVATGGANPEDGDGYTISIDGGSPVIVARNATTTFGNVAIGEHSVLLAGIAANCTVGGNPASVLVQGNATATVSFAVSCDQRYGSVTVSTTTTGSDIDPNGYVVIIEGLPAQSVATSASVTIPNVPTGAATVTLGGISTNCSIAGSPGRNITVTAGAQISVEFSLTCHEGLIAFWSNRDGGNVDIYTMFPDGSNVVRLTTHPSFDEQPAWSPDGRRIAFTSGRTGGDDIYIMQEDGSGVQRLTTSNSRDWHPSWSPDGTELVFTSNRDGNNEIYVMNADGSNQRNLTNSIFSETESRFSPDGTRIVFVSDRDGDIGEIYSMGASGTNVLRLTNSALFDGRPAYSKDGDRILFYSARDRANPVGCCYPEIYSMNADGSNPMRLTNNIDSDAFPSFSPDGTNIVFATSRDGDWEIYIMNANGGSPTNLTRSPWVEMEPVWRATHATAAARTNRSEALSRDH